MSEHPSSNTQISSSADRLSEQASLLFDGDYDLEEVTDEMVRSIALIASPAYHGASEHIGPAGSAYIGEKNYSDSVDIDGDIPLADILKASQTTMVSQQALVKVAVTGASEADIPASADKENKHTQVHIPSEKTRWYTNAFVKATQLDSLRHFHLKMKASTTTQVARSSKRQSPVSKNGNVIRRKKGRNSNSSTIDGAKVFTNTSAPSVSTGLDPAIATSGTQVQQTIQPCTKKAFRFDEVVAVYETWDRHTYDRRGMPLTRLDAEQLETIKDELNSFKMHEMSVHEDSRTNTHIIF
ncbi:hypothetical protein GGH99_002403 [Coemansia sp. RSA 1285]|nr:hypothetical protein EV177_005709 [Coemansia sp. RSA 1804]KAJ2691466.1 hypothetical protein GGH99_002403 [Coemansia sp. RSA 1285]